MTILLDTHVVLWIAEDSPKLSKNSRDLLMDPRNKKFVSIASAWEVAIKLGRDDFQLEGGLSEFFRIITGNDYLILPIKEQHLSFVPILPKIHKDPFDRLLIATTIAEKMIIMTIDENIHKYNVDFVW